MNSDNKALFIIVYHRSSPAEWLLLVSPGRDQKKKKGTTDEHQ
jgi:hypothetical protein